MGSLCEILREPQDPPAHGLSLHCPCACAAETRSAHPRSCSFQNRRAITAAFVSPLLLPIRHATLPPPPSRRPWSICIRAMPSVAFSSTASDQCIAHQLGRGLSSPSWNTVMHCTLSPCTLRDCSSSSCCWTRARFSLAASHLHMSEPRASLTRSHFAGSASLLPRLAFRRTPWLRPRYGYRVPASRTTAFHHYSSCACRCSARRTPVSPARAHGSALLRIVRLRSDPVPALTRLRRLHRHRACPIARSCVARAHSEPQTHACTGSTPRPTPLSASARARRLCRSPVTQHRTCICCCSTVQVLPAHPPAPARASTTRLAPARCLPPLRCPLRLLRAFRVCLCRAASESGRAARSHTPNFLTRSASAHSAALTWARLLPRSAWAAAAARGLRLRSPSRLLRLRAHAPRQRAPAPRSAYGRRSLLPPAAPPGAACSAPSHPLRPLPQRASSRASSSHARAARAPGCRIPNAREWKREMGSNG
jgi:hypothetical protein